MIPSLAGTALKPFTVTSGCRFNTPATDLFPTDLFPTDLFTTDLFTTDPLTTDLSSENIFSKNHCENRTPVIQVKQAVKCKRKG